MAITVLELAIFRGAKELPNGTFTTREIERVGLPFMGGCGECGACIAAYNAAPSKLGYLMCSNGCIGSNGYATCEEANLSIFPEEYEWKGVASPLKQDEVKYHNGYCDLCGDHSSHLYPPTKGEVDGLCPRCHRENIRLTYSH